MNQTILFEKIPVAIYKDGKLFKEFDSRKAAAIYLKVSHWSLSNTIKRRGKMSSMVSGKKEFYHIRNGKESKK